MVRRGDEWPRKEVLEGRDYLRQRYGEEEVGVRRNSNSRSRVVESISSVDDGEDDNDIATGEGREREERKGFETLDCNI